MTQSPGQAEDGHVAIDGLGSPGLDLIRLVPDPHIAAIAHDPGEIPPRPEMRCIGISGEPLQTFG